MLQKRWNLPVAPPEEVGQALADYGPIERQILFLRDIGSAEDANRFLQAEQAEEHDPFLLLGMEQAVDRLRLAVQEKEKIVVYGDYDADGITATVLMVELLEKMGIEVGHYIPNRFKEGYGLNAEAVKRIRKDGAQILLTVDCGVRALEEVALAKELGMDVIVTDHHEPGETVPAAKAIIDPKQSKDGYPFKHLAGVGIAYKLAQAIAKKMGIGSNGDWLDLVALGTVADVSELSGENRILVSRGLRRLNACERVGLRALAKIAGIALGRIDCNAIGFAIAPRINAAGRIGSAETSLRLLRSEESSEATKLALELEQMNRKRQRMTRDAIEKAREVVKAEDQVPLLILAAHPEFHQGVVGLAASRLRDKFYRLAIVGAQGEEETRCSARSIPEVSIIAALEKCSELLIRYGGHDTAAGFTLATRNIDALRDQLLADLEDKLDEKELIPELNIDCEVGLGDLTYDLMRFLEAMEPCGRGNPRPVLMARNLSVLNKRRVGSEGRHLKLTLGGRDRVFDGIAFRQGERMDSLAPKVDAAFYFERNEFRGIESMQLNVVDMRSAE
ncbi:MAG: single-stranded-DNA-specific exonuclease RecJ [Anaerolineales bacterium]|jgi:single-stranded-DNA-specific exonuclease